MTKKSILMTGYGHGHNIHTWLRFFSKNDRYDLTFIPEGEYKFENYENICVIECRSKFDYIKTLVTSFFSRKNSIFFLHNAYNVKLAMLYLLFFRYTRSCLMVWGYGVVNDSLYSKNLGIRLLYRVVFRLVDNICVNYPLKDIIANNFEKLRSKLKVHYWGLGKDFFNETETEISQFTHSFLASIPPDDIFIFWPRSILKVTRFDLAVEAMNRIKSIHPDLVKTVKIIIWQGNAINTEYKEQLLQMISEYGLSNQIQIFEHLYLPMTDIKAIWKRCDFSINIIENDGFSTQLGEAFYTKKPILLSRIPAYTTVDEKFHLSLDFVDNTVDDIAEKLFDFIKNYKKYNADVLEKRKDFCQSYLCFEDNLSDLIESIEKRKPTKFDEV